MNTQNTSAPRSNPRVVIIGSGFGGLGMAIQLKKAGIDSFVVLEKADRLGGTWRDNTYPGAACDVQSHLYSYSFEPKHDWTRKFGLQAEIRDYMEDCASKYGLHAHIRYQQEVASAAFDKDAGLWTITTRSGEVLQAQVLVSAVGQLNQPAYPKIPGIETFKGRAFHSARWEHDAGLDGQSVAVIGTGASAIQFVPQIAPKVKQLTLFQRSGAWVIPKADRPFARIEQRLFESLPLFDRVYRTSIYWKNEVRALGFTRFGGLLEAWAWQSRRNMRRDIKDPVKRQKLMPDYKIGCKRLLISNDWFPAINRDNVEVVTDRIERIEADAVVTADGTRHQVDTIIYGTGFAATEFLTPMKITGIDGLDLNEAWKDGAEAYKGTCVSGFPNLFILYGPNTNLAHSSIIFMLESQFRYVMRCLHTLSERSLSYMNVRAESQRRYSEKIQKRIQSSVWLAGCDSWYINKSGKVTNNWPGYTFNFRRMTSRLELQDYELQTAPVVVV
ncbi:flavin-containing monooxygenase [Solimonas terrae]|uniref:NAD(P)/FAD-dependent oxidoreductase n=1 Tax=Solimonas terrae TaxID=1396819 RepID=A0A6M2BM27_9GAMM|nr:NAD(P)/FAD-dependent oxidoreductase [Solimonas terrae]NGY03742.1 NAD(P)/FAD-dependent oxidoreductase [Solimonas terrae]